MSVSSVATAAKDLLMPNAATQKVSSQGINSTTATLRDQISIGESNPFSEYLTYTKAETTSGNTEIASSSANSKDSGTQTDSEKWDVIVSKYNMKSMNLNDYGNMLCDLGNAGLLTFDEVGSALFNAGAKYSIGLTVEDMKNGVLGDSGTSLFDYRINFSELLNDVTNKDKKNYFVYDVDKGKEEYCSRYDGYDPNNDQQAFLEESYTKMKAYANE